MTSRAALIKRLDMVFSKIIRKSGRCARCGKTANLQCAHVFSRRNRGTRWDVKNALCLCAGCHFFWAHQSPVEFTEFIKKRLGADEYEKLRYRAGRATKFTEGELKLLLRNVT